MNQNLAKVLEWSVWANLDSCENLELTLLKGHLILELIMDSILSSKNASYSELSFFRKVKVIKGEFENASNKPIFHYLLELNNLRNKLAHEYNFKVESGELQRWADSVLSTNMGMKYTKFTYRTKIVHGFSSLAYSLASLEIKP